MLKLTYPCQCDCGRLVAELVTAGFAQHPNPGARFYGVGCDDGGGVHETTVYGYADLTSAEQAAIASIVNVHVYTAPAAVYADEVYIRSPDKSTWKITVDNAGILSTTKVT